MDRVVFEAVKAVLGGILRWLLTLVLGGLLARGVIQGEHIAVIAPAVAGLLVTGGWSVWTAYRRELRIRLALWLDGGTSREQLEAELRRVRKAAEIPAK